MNSSRDPFEDAFMKNLVAVGLGVIITYINGIFVFAFFRNPVFYTDTRYILYVHLIINDIIMLFLSVTLYVLSYALPSLNVAVCSFLLLLTATTSENTPLNLAAMALERYVAICKPLHHPQLCSVTRTYVLIGLIWLLTFAPALTDILIVLANEPVSVFSMSVICYSKNVYGSNQHLMKTITVEALYLSGVWMTLLFTYLKVFQAAKSATSDQMCDYMHTDRYQDCPEHHVTVNKDCSGVVPDCHGGTQNGSGSSSVTSPALVLVETTNESVCGGTVVRVKISVRMNSSRDPFEDAFMKNFVAVGLGVIITYINGIFVFAFFNNPVFYTDTRYILYVHLVINDIIMLFLSVTLHVLTYALPFVNVTVCSFLLLLASVTSENTPLNLAAMALERYVAICKPLHHPQLCSVNRAYILIGLIWLLTFIPALTDILIVLANQPISVFSTSIICYQKSLFGSNQHLIRSIIIEALYLSCVWMTLLFTYLKILQAAKAATSDQVSARKARNTVLLHGLQLLLCMLTYVTPLLNYFLLALFPKYKTIFMYIAYIVSNILPRLLSPLIYGVRDKKMYRYVRMYFICSVYNTKIKPKANEN
ncbi:hypothetical protein NFI96_007907 [Prochilodus magdalenae]|nr:hypothetical protein NFI96_007907 [Prochilodus magdalenae]